jgi:hypothetical protein
MIYLDKLSMVEKLNFCFKINQAFESQPEGMLTQTVRTTKAGPLEADRLLRGCLELVIGRPKCGRLVD